MSCVCTPVEFAKKEPLEDLLRHMMPYTPGVPAQMALDLIREAYKVFARRTSFLVFRSVQDGQFRVRDYPLSVPEGYETYLVLGRKTLSAVHNWNGDNPTYYNDFEVIDNTLIRMNAGYSKDEECGIEIHTVVIPTDCCEYMPASLSSAYGRGIALGAVAMAMRLPNQPFSSPRMADKFDLDFQRVISQAKGVAVRNRRVGGIRAKPVRVC